MPAWVVRPGRPTEPPRPLGGPRPRPRRPPRGDDPGDATAARRGLDLLVPTYRNDEGVPSGPDGRYALGLSEWRDVEAAIRTPSTTARARCSSWAGRWVGRSCSRCSTAPGSPAPRLPRRARRRRSSTGATCWPTTPAGTGCPRHVGSLARTMMRQRWGHRLVGVHERVDLAQDRLGQPGRRAAAPDAAHPLGRRRVRAGRAVPRARRARPDLVTLEEWQVARHCKEWNTDPQRWESLVREFATG